MSTADSSLNSHPEIDRRQMINDLVHYFIYSMIHARKNRSPERGPTALQETVHLGGRIEMVHHVTIGQLKRKRIPVLLLTKAISSPIFKICLSLNYISGLSLASRVYARVNSNWGNSFVMVVVKGFQVKLILKSNLFYK
jgi:hypothetical protein